MLVLISPEQDIHKEHTILNQLFEEGLEYFHLRKPDQSIDEFRRYLDSIDAKYHNRVMLHAHQELLQDYNIKGVHLQEQVRKSLFDHIGSFVSAHQNLNFMVSSSFHDPVDIKASDADFDYMLLSPVFNAISKSDYEGKGFDVNGISGQIIGMGGVSADNIEETRNLGYQGVGVLGGVWNNEDPLVAFKAIKKEVDRYFQ